MPLFLIISVTRPLNDDRAVGQQPSHVPGAEEAVRGDRICRLAFAGADVAAHDIAADLDHALFAAWQFRAGIGIDDADFHTRQRRSLAGGAPFQRPVMRRDAAIAVALRLAVDIADLARTKHRRCCNDILRRTDGQARAQAAHSLRPECRMRNDGTGDRRQRVERRATVPLDQVDRLARLEPALQDQVPRHV